MEILDIHTHHAYPQPEGIISICLHTETSDIALSSGQRYSVGIHPWDTVSEISDATYAQLESLAALPETVAIGETGIDLNIGGPLFRQMQVLRRHIELSERLGKPLIIHDVKGHDVITGARRDLKPLQNWAIHGFRQKPEVADMLLRAGCYISFGPQFNAETVRAVPEEMILAETDDSETTIQSVIERISEARDRDMLQVIAANTKRFLERQ